MEVDSFGNPINPALPIISASRIKMFKTCGKRYELRYIHKLPDTRNVAALIGSAVHKAIELKFTQAAKPNVVYQTYIEDAIESIRDLRGSEYLAQNKVTGREMLLAINWDLFNPLEVEKQFILPFPNKDNPICYINGYIDIIDKEGFIVDHKTSIKRPSQDVLLYDIQFLLYFWAYKELYNKEPTNVYWHHLRTGELIPVPVRDRYEIKIAMLTEDIVAMLSTTHFGRIQYNKEICVKQCPFFDICYGTTE